MNAESLSMSVALLFRPVVIPTGGPAKPGRNGGISSRPGGTPDSWRDPSTPRCCARDDKRGRGFALDNRRIEAFTLIELLVVISIVVLLMALLFPALSRARKQARAVACQTNLKEWGLHFATLASENDGRLPEWETDPDLYESNDRQAGSWLYWGHERAADPLAYTVTRKMRLCPSASKLASDVFDIEDYDALGTELFSGGTFLAWGQWLARVPGIASVWDCPNYSSYGLNPWCWRPAENTAFDRVTHDRLWPTVHVRGAGHIPFMLDGTWLFSGPGLDNQAPPLRDAVPVGPGGCAFRSCINRHNGGVNGLFMDWSVRKVDLKELWTLKWAKWYDTAGPWTKAGGVQPSDWPEWMRKFKAY